MGGTLLNIITVAIGGTLGMLVGNRLSQRVQESVVIGLGLITLVVGLQNAFLTGNIIIPLLAILIGVIIGELLGIDRALEDFAGWLQARTTGQQSTESTTQDVEGMTPRERFITGFVTASLVFCVGPLTFIGSVQDGMGLAAGFQFLAIKSVLDGFAAMAFAASFGIGVLFTIVTVFVVQGGLALVGFVIVRTLVDTSAVDALTTNPIILELTATGGIILIGLALVLLDVKKPRVANFLPALLIAPLLVWLAGLVGIPVYPL